MINCTFRPLLAWTDPETVERKPPLFRALWDQTVRLLREEADLLDATSLVVQVVCAEVDLRVDGMLKARAKVEHPGAVVSMDTPVGPLRFATDRYEGRYYSDPPDWQSNVRAIALSLESLRAVNRYGVTHRGEQYRGWLAIEPGAGEPTSQEDARKLIDSYGGLKSALRRTHPDQGGGAGDFQRVLAARRLLGL